MKRNVATMSSFDLNFCVFAGSKADYPVSWLRQIEFSGINQRIIQLVYQLGSKSHKAEDNNGHRLFEELKGGKNAKFNYHY